MDAASFVALAADTKDPVQASWSARAELATRRLGKGGLDACDTAVEKAFQTAKQTPEKDGRTFNLSIDVDGQILLALYRYRGNTLDGFPPGQPFRRSGSPTRRPGTARTFPLHPSARRRTAPSASAPAAPRTMGLCAGGPQSPLKGRIT